MRGFTLIELMIVIAIIAIIAAIAIPNIVEARVTANEAAAAASLRSGVQPAEIQFQAGNYQDADYDNLGEYGTLGALAGLVPTTLIGMQPDGHTGLHLLQGAMASGENWSGVVTASLASPALALNSGYFFTAIVGAGVDSLTDTGRTIWFEGAEAPLGIGLVGSPGHATGYMANGATQALPAPAGGLNLQAGWVANFGEHYMVVGCAPMRYGSTGRRPFLIGPDGLVRSPTRGEAIGAFYQGVANNGWNAQIPSGAICTAATLARGIAVGMDPAYITGTVTPAAPTTAIFDADSSITPPRIPGVVNFEPYLR